MQIYLQINMEIQDFLKMSTQTSGGLDYLTNSFETVGYFGGQKKVLIHTLHIISV